MAAAAVFLVTVALPVAAGSGPNRLFNPSLERRIPWRLVG